MIKKKDKISNIYRASTETTYNFGGKKLLISEMKTHQIKTTLRYLLGGYENYKESPVTKPTSWDIPKNSIFFIFIEELQWRDQLPNDWVPSNNNIQKFIKPCLFSYIPYIDEYVIIPTHKLNKFYNSDLNFETHSPYILSWTNTTTPGSKEWFTYSAYIPNSSKKTST